MFASEVVREWEMAWLQSDDRVSGDRPLRLAGKTGFYRNPPCRADQAYGFFGTLRTAGVLTFPRGDQMAIENHFGDSIMASCCIVAIVYEFSHITSLRKKSATWA